MATKLALYQGALRLLKHRRISTLADADPARYQLDDVYDGALAYMLEQGQWNFASRSTSLSGAVSANRGYAYRFTKPADFVRLISISNSTTYYPPLEDYDEDATYWYSNETTLYITYVSSDASYGGNLSAWPETYAKAVEAYLAMEIGPHVTNSNEILKVISAAYDQALRIAIVKDSINRSARVLSPSTLSVYNGALRLLGQRQLTRFDERYLQRRHADIAAPDKRPPTDDIETELRLRRLLDEAYTLSLRYVLEQAQWTFATTSATIVGSASSNRGFSYRFAKPAELVRVVALSTSPTYYPPLENYAEDALYWFGNDATIYLTYVSNGASLGADTTKWPATFQRVLEAQLAIEIAPHVGINGDIYKALRQEYATRLVEGKAKDAINRTTRVLSTGTLAIYNAALRLVGRRFITNFDDRTVQKRSSDASRDSPERRMPADDVEMELVLRRLLDESYDPAVNYLLQQGLWNFGSRTVSIEHETDVEPEFGYTHAFEKPDDWVRLVAISNNETLWPTLDRFVEEGEYIFADDALLYVQYVSSGTTYGGDMSKWPPTFKRALEYYLALEIAPHAGLGVAATDRLQSDYRRLMRDAKGKDASDQAVQWPSPGRLVQARVGWRRHTDQRRGER